MQAAVSAGCNSPLRWHLIFTKQGAESLARENLVRQGYSVYYPRLLQRVRRRGSWREVICPLFPRYLFVRVNSEVQSLGAMCSTLGVASVVRFGAEYVVVRDEVVRGIVASEDPESGLHRLRGNRGLAAGCPVRIIEGALSGFEGIFERNEGQARVVVLIALLGRQASIKLPVDSIAPTAAI